MLVAAVAGRHALVHAFFPLIKRAPLHILALLQALRVCAVGCQRAAPSAWFFSRHVKEHSPEMHPPML